MAFLAPLGAAGAAGAGAAAAGASTIAGTASALGAMSGVTAASLYTPLAAGISGGAAAAGTAAAATTGAGLTVGNIFGLIGSAFSAVGSIQQGNAAQAAAEYNAQLARQNSVLARQAAAEDERRHRVQSRKQLGAIRTGYGASGVTVEGSPSDILDESAIIAELDALTIRAKGAQAAGAFESSARVQTQLGKTAKKQSYFGAASSLLKGGANVYANWPI